MSNPLVLKLALPVPLRTTFDYLPPKGLCDAQVIELEPGTRFKVEFGQQKILTGILLSTGLSNYPRHKLKTASEQLETHSLVPEDTLELAKWASDYYKVAIGEVIQAALPKPLRHHTPIDIISERHWELSTEGKGVSVDGFKRSKKQAALLKHLQSTNAISASELKSLGFTNDVIRRLLDKQLIQPCTHPDTEISVNQSELLREHSLPLNSEQETVMKRFRYDHFETYLLEGATGSGKTEVYLQAIAKVLRRGRQALILIPEIGLTPQTLDRVRQRFKVKVVELHSNISDKQRWLNWHACATGAAHIAIGTRLAVFTPFKALGIIVVDEEHDLSFKQQDGVRYSARDLSIVRARTRHIPLILGSATPSLESLNNANKQRYQLLQLTRRAGQSSPPSIQCVDMRQQNDHSNLSTDSQRAINAALTRGEQVLIFLNRRGYAPSLICETCGWSMVCKRCDSHMTLHRSPPHMRCHHCNTRRPQPTRCEACGNPKLRAYGLGTERLEESLASLFPNTDIVRVDKDSMARKNAMQELTKKVQAGQPCILVGTQMLAKGHHFPKLTLVIVVDADAGLLSGDFRGSERVAQLIMQVAGRAGRAEQPGLVLLQSYKPEHPFFHMLIHKGYHEFALQTLQERQYAKLPPHWFMCLINAESKRAEIATEFLLMAKTEAEKLIPKDPDNSYLLGPLPALLERKDDRLRYQLHFYFAQRKQLQQLLLELLPILDDQAISKRCRWSIDVDPAELG